MGRGVPPSRLRWVPVLLVVPLRLQVHRLVLKVLDVGQLGTGGVFRQTLFEAYEFDLDVFDPAGKDLAFGCRLGVLMMQCHQKEVTVMHFRRLL